MNFKSCDHVYSFGPNMGSHCPRLVTEPLCPFHSVVYTNRDPQLARDVCSFLMEMLSSLEDMDINLIDSIWSECQEDIQECVKHNWDTASKDELYLSIKSILDRRNIPVA